MSVTSQVISTNRSNFLSDKKTSSSDKKPSSIVLAGGPDGKEQRMAMIEDKYWTVLNSSMLRRVANDKNLESRVNALKNSLQTYGPTSLKLPSFINNTGKALGHVFHGHANDSNGCTFVLEWTIIDVKKRIMAIINFDTHENYPFRQKPLDEKEKTKILVSDESMAIMSNVATKIKEAKEKEERKTTNQRNFL